MDKQNNTYKACKKKLIEALEKDQLWVAVREFLLDHRCEDGTTCSFSYNTPSAIPSMQLLRSDIMTVGEGLSSKCKMESLIRDIKEASFNHSVAVGDKLGFKRAKSPFNESISWC